MEEPDARLGADRTDYPPDGDKQQAGRSGGVALVFCTNLTGTPEAEAAYGAFWREAAILFYPLANAGGTGEMGAREAREAFEPYRQLAPWVWDFQEMEEHENGFPSAEWSLEWGPGPGSEDFWREADALGIPGVVYSEGDHPGAVRTSRCAAGRRSTGCGKA